jgi:hypothetical protein
LRRRFKRESALPGPLICEAVTQKQDKIMYTKKMFGTELKERVLKKQDITEIGHWTYSMYLKHIDEINDPGFDDILLTLNTMEDGSEFAFTYEELNQIADDLITGKDVKF